MDGEVVRIQGGVWEWICGFDMMEVGSSRNL